uniref:Uncharacterized protein n=1 Tax=Triticum urartu TaxID=4572 RepID=A0A8R7PBM3_TRIUA
MRSCSSAGRRKAQLRCGSSPVGRRSSATPARTEYCLGYNLPRAALLYKEIDLVIRDDGGRLYDRGKVNMSPLCNKTTGTSPNVCSIEGKKELFMSCYFKIPKRFTLPLLVT